MGKLLDGKRLSPIADCLELRNERIVRLYRSLNAIIVGLASIYTLQSD